MAILKRIIVFFTFFISFQWRKGAENPLFFALDGDNIIDYRIITAANTRTIKCGNVNTLNLASNSKFEKNEIQIKFPITVQIKQPYYQVHFTLKLVILSVRRQYLDLKIRVNTDDRYTLTKISENVKYSNKDCKTSSDPDMAMDPGDYDEIDLEYSVDISNEAGITLTALELHAFLKKDPNDQNFDMTGKWGIREARGYIYTCDKSCKSCTGPEANNCKSCYPVFKYDSGNCNCGNGFTQYALSSCTDLGCLECRPCSFNCKECQKTSGIDICTSCIDSDTFNNGACNKPSSLVKAESLFNSESTFSSAEIGKFEVLMPAPPLDLQLKCGSMQVFGLFDKSTKIIWNKALAFSGFAISSYYSLRVSFVLLKIPAWTTTDTMKFRVNDKEVSSTIVLFDNFIGDCGKLGLQIIYEKHVINTTLYSHETDRLKLEIQSDTTEGSWGIAQFNMYLDFCNPKCKACYGPSEFNCVDCPDYKFLGKDNTCLYCPQPYCLKCISNESADKCTKCDLKSYFLQRSQTVDAILGECVQTCPEKMYPDSNRVCQICATTCASCDGPTNGNCTRCMGGLYFIDKKCELECPENYFKNNQNPENQICSKCFAGCEHCDNSDQITCTSCLKGYFLKTPPRGPCQETCPLGTYQQLTLKQCLKCSTECSTCSGSGADSCSNCNENYLLEGTSCKSECSFGLYGYKDTRLCLKCYSYCNECTGTNINECTSCIPPYYLDGNTCNPSCPLKKFGDSQDPKRSCKSCDTSCQSCNGTSNLNCLSCPTSFYLRKDGSCASTCLDQQFIRDSKCENCHSTCKTCNSEAKDQCLTCVYNLFFYSNSCLDKCPDKYAPDDGNICFPCAKGCFQCINVADNCLACDGNYAKMKSENKCVEDCGNYFFKESNLCKDCHISCTTCTGPFDNNCQSCKPEKPLLYEGKCYDAAGCPSSTYPNKNLATCVKCSVSCKTCTADAVCQSCNKSYFLYQSSCGGTCPDAYFPDDSTNTCEKCDVACHKCTGRDISQCSECASPYFLEKDSTICVQQCNIGTYGDSTLRKCLKCIDKCTGCKDGTNFHCDSCSKGYYLEGTTCDSTCPERKFKDDNANKCQSCSPECIKCTGSTIDNCQECEIGWFLQSPSSCLLKCKDGYFGNRATKACNLCSTACSLCSETATKCSKCKTQYFLEGTDCKSSCSPGLYGDTADNICKKCNTKCATCTGSDETKCLTCVTGLLLEQNQCRNSCSDGFYNKLDGTCAFCNNECATCSGPQNSECRSCVDGYYLEKGFCKNKCEDGSYQNKALGSCDKCNKECRTCKGPLNTDCITCNIGTNLLKEKNICVVNCPDGYYGQNETCHQCDPRCLICNGPTNNNCFKCESSLLNNQSCQDSCPSGRFPLRKNNSCEDCHPTCETCLEKSDKDCETCKLPRYLLKLNDSDPGCTAVECQEKGSCVNSCPWNLKAIETPRECQKKCHFTCLNLECESPEANNCTACVAGRKLTKRENFKGGSCDCNLKEYPANQTSDDITCKSITYNVNKRGFKLLKERRKLETFDLGCHPSCATCYGPNNNNCKSCPDYKDFRNGQCKCPIGFDIGGSCGFCHKSCVECQGPENTSCTKCLTPQQVLVPEGVGQCKCAEGYFEEAPSCTKCDYTCKSCRSSDQDSCIECASNRIQKSGFCVCPPNYREVPNEATCVVDDITTDCSLKSCKQCYQKNRKFCLECADNRKKGSEGACECPTGFYENKETGECTKCHFSCSACKGPDWNQCRDQCSSFVRGIEGIPDQGTCTCGNDYTENFEPNCSVKTDTEKNLKSTFGATTISSAVTMTVVGSGISTVIAFRFVESCQLLSFMKYINIQYPLNFDSYLNTLTKFNIDRLFSNPGLNMASMAPSKFSSLSNDTNSLRNDTNSLLNDTNSLPNDTNSLPNDTNSLPNDTKTVPTPENQNKTVRILLATNISDQVPSQKFYLDDLSTSFLYNGLPVLIILASVAVFTGLLHLVGEVMINNPSLFIAKLSKFVRWGLFLRVYQMVFLQLNLYIFLQLKSFSTNNSFNIASLAITIVVLILEAVMFIFVIYTLNCCNLDDAEVSSKFECLWDGVDTIYMSRRNYTSMNMLRKLLTVIVLVYAFNTPKIQVGFIFAINFLFLLYVALIRPFKIAFEWVYNLIIESLISLFILLVLIYTLVDQDGFKIVFGWFLISLMIFLMISALVFTIYVLLKVCYRSWGTIKKRIRQKTIFAPSLEHSMTMGADRSLENPMKNLLQSDVILGQSPDRVLFSKKEHDEKYREKNIKRMMEERMNKDVEMKTLEKYKSEEEAIDQVKSSPKNIHIVVQNSRFDSKQSQQDEPMDEDEEEGHPGFGSSQRKLHNSNKLQVTGRHQKHHVKSSDLSADSNRHLSEPQHKKALDDKDKGNKSKSAEISKVNMEDPFEAVMMKDVETGSDKDKVNFKKGEKVVVIRVDAENNFAEVRSSKDSVGKINLNDLGVQEY